MVKVYNSGNTFGVEQILLTLKENNIPAYKKEDGAGSNGDRNRVFNNWNGYLRGRGKCR